MLMFSVTDLWNVIWPYAIGGCTLNRDVKKTIFQAGKWENFDSIEGNGQPWSMLPRVWGELRKAQDE